MSTIAELERQDLRTRAREELRASAKSATTKLDMDWLEANCLGASRTESAIEEMSV